MRFVPVLFLVLIALAVMLLMPRFFKPIVITDHQAENAANITPSDVMSILNRTNETTANATNTTADDFQKFVKKLGESERVAVIMDITDAGKNAVEVYNCGAALAWQLASSGKNVSNYVFENRTCTSAAENETKSRGIDDCVDEIGTTPSFYIGLMAKNETTVYEDLIVVLGDREYICNINIKLTNKTSSNGAGGG